MTKSKKRNSKSKKSDSWNDKKKSEKRSEAVRLIEKSSHFLVVIKSDGPKDVEFTDGEMITVGISRADLVGIAAALVQSVVKDAGDISPTEIRERVMRTLSTVAPEVFGKFNEKSPRDSMEVA